MSNPFIQHTLGNVPTNIYNDLAAETFDEICNGRQGTILVKCKDNLIPIVRTTTNYGTSSHHFRPVHDNIIHELRHRSSIDLQFNNAMAEIYENQYKTMRFHSDLALDLADDSYICIFSCYSDPKTRSVRKLVTRNKTTGQVTEIILSHCSAVIFSVKTNQQYVHKIVLNDEHDSVKWLGLTFRLSNTYIRFTDGIPFFANKTQLVLANVTKLKEFCSLKRRENDEIGFDYPSITYTLNCSDLMIPKMRFESVIHAAKTCGENTILLDHKAFRYDENDTKINPGQIPINIHNVGIYFRQAFDPSVNYFEKISSEHKFQSLTESNKPGVAYRTGLYITKVTNNLEFNLLRCSSNFDGPTENMRDSDNEIFDTANRLGSNLFHQEVKVNHCLAQIYNNVRVQAKERKASIKEHSDKTKDMPRNGLLAFCTFYKDYYNGQFNDEKLGLKQSGYDYCYKDVSALTKIRFRLKHPEKYSELKDKFEVTLYPHSLFIVSLMTNRLYTHEIIPPNLPIDRIPTRMGYVIRCSKTIAIHKEGQTYISDNGNHIKMESPDQERVAILKKVYAQENLDDNLIEYDKLYFSLNQGDYIKPVL